MQLQDALDRFLVQLQADGRSIHTRNQYARHIRAFAAWLPHGGPRRAVQKIGHEDVAAFLAAPVARTAAHGGSKRAISMNAMRTSLRCFFRYLHEAGAVAQNPARLVRRAMCAPRPRVLGAYWVVLTTYWTALTELLRWCRAERSQLSQATTVELGIVAGNVTWPADPTPPCMISSEELDRQRAALNAWRAKSSPPER